MIYRRDHIAEICKGKDVLHLGCAHHDLFRTLHEQKTWLHSMIASHAKSLVGIDYLEEAVSQIHSEFGFECYRADVMKLDDLDLDREFDVVVCSELIEHIENPGLMLEGVKRFMRPDGELIITTPNPWSSEKLKLIFKGSGEVNWLNEEHVCWYSYQTLKQLIERMGYKLLLDDYYISENKSEYENPDGAFWFLRKIKRKLVDLFLPKRFYRGLFFVVKID